MLQAKKLGMKKAGYAFICYELLLDSCLDEENTLTNEEREQCDALNGMLDISLFVPQDEKYTNFSKQVRKKMAQHPFYRVMPDEEDVSI